MNDALRSESISKRVIYRPDYGLIKVFLNIGLRHEDGC